MAIEISRIEKEFIFKYMVDSAGNCELVRSGKHFAAVLQSASPKGLNFRLTNPVGEVSALDVWVDVYFFFKGTRITCRTRVLEQHGTDLVAQYPDHLYRDLSRNYERLRPQEDVGVSILLEGTTLKMNFPVYGGGTDAAPPTPNVKFDANRIADLLKGFREKVKSFTSENKIVMFRERQPELVTEHLVAWSGKILMLPLGDAVSPFKRRGEDRTDILQESDVRDILKSSGKDPLLLSQELSNHVDAMFQKKIWHELYVPILYGSYVIGYIYLLRSDTQNGPFSPVSIDFVRQFAKILAYSLAANNYFTAVPVRDSFNQSELVDMSGSGLLFSMPLSGPVVELLTDIDLHLHFRERTIAVQGRVMRRFQEGGRIFVGIKFLELADADLDFIMHILYGSSDGFRFSDEPILTNS